MKKIILVEDHPDLAEISASLLREVHGHEVRVARTGTGALAAAQAGQVDLMLIDLNLPDMDGFELARRLRADPRFQSTVLVALTGFSNDEIAPRARAAGFDAYYRKPMDFDLLDTLGRVLP